MKRKRKKIEKPVSRCKRYPFFSPLLPFSPAVCATRRLYAWFQKIERLRVWQGASIPLYEADGARSLKNTCPPEPPTPSFRPSTFGIVYESSPGVEGKLDYRRSNTESDQIARKGLHPSSLSVQRRRSDRHARGTHTYTRVQSNSPCWLQNFAFRRQIERLVEHADSTPSPQP